MRSLTQCFRSIAAGARALLGIDPRPNAITAITPDSDSAQYDLARKYHHEMRLEDAEAIYQMLLAKYPGDFDLLHMLGVLQGQRGNFVIAMQFLEQALDINPQSAPAHGACGNVLKGLGRHIEALARYDRALALQPNNADIWNNRGATLMDLGQAEKALESYDHALAINPRHVSALDNRGTTLRALRRLEDSLASHDSALAIQPDNASAHYHRGTVLAELQRNEEALGSYDQALALRPDYTDALTGRGATLKSLKRHHEALASFEQVLKHVPKNAIAHYNCGIVLIDLRRHEEALARFDQALAWQPDLAEAHDSRGMVLRSLRRYEEALSSFGKALAINPDLLSSLHNRGDLLLYRSKPEDAAADFVRLTELAPDYDYAIGNLLHARMLCCDWRDLETRLSAICSGISEDKKSAAPFHFLAISTTPALMKRCSEIYAAKMFPPATHTPPFTARKHGKIRLGYVAGEFRHHATSLLLINLLECHDTARFELYAFDNGWDDGSSMRKRLAKVFGHIIDISRLGDEEATREIRNREIDILVDLNGHVGLKRTGIFSRRAAPIQVNWLGFPGTMGVSYMDYIIGDANTIPPGHDAYYSEKVVRLPDTYQVNDPKRGIAARTPTRTDLKLPASGFVFCCFNNNYKITPEVFDIWMRLLRTLDGSVMWLLEGNATVSRNLRSEAMARGVSPERLIFAPRMNLPDHLARHRAADLFLDTLPCNAHTTASDALWAGLPVLTCMGPTFAGRVAGSLLHAIGLPDLATGNLRDYETLALKLAVTPDLLSDIRTRLARHKTTHPLFDGDRFRHHIEAAYITMFEHLVHGEPPKSFTVPPAA